MKQKLIAGVIALAAFAAGAADYSDENITATDATVVRYETSDGYAYAFTNPAAGTVTVTLNRLRKLSRWLVVGGGGAGGTVLGGGGGGGGVRFADNVGSVLASGAAMTLQVGAGGAITSGQGARGGDSTLILHDRTEIVALGSGGGRSYNGADQTANTGASSGGGSEGSHATPFAVTATDPQQGHVGGTSTYIGAGGGGYSEAGGSNAPSSREVEGTVVNFSYGGKGGDGYSCDITGETHVYGSGGGGAAGWGHSGGINNLPGEGGAESGGRGGRSALDTSVWPDLSGEPGVDGLGGGGGGGGNNGNLDVNKNPGKGGSGCVILRLVALAAGDKALVLDAIPNQPATGAAVTPSVTVRDAVSGTVLTQKTHYTVAYSDNVNPGYATVTVTGMTGSDYAGCVATGTFLIVHPRRGGKDVYLFLGGANVCASAQAGGPAAAVSNIMANAESDAEVVIVNAAVSASKLSTWVKLGSSYNAAVTAAQAAQTDGNIRAIFWMQGEEDAATESVRTAYAATLAEIVAALREDLSIADSIPFIAATLPETSSTGVNSCRALNENLRTLPDLLAYSRVVESRDLMLNAYNVKLLCAESTRTLGLRMANAFFELERQYAKGNLVVGELGPQAISGSDTIAPAVTVTDTNGATVASSDYDVTYRGVSTAGFGVAVVEGKTGTAAAGFTTYAPFRVMTPVFAAPDGDADADGSSWDEATTFEHAVTLANGTNEVWLKKGTYARTNAYSMVVSMFVRGGFEGVAGNRNDGEYSIFDGSRTISSIFTGTHTGNPAADTYKTYIERIDFRGANGDLISHPGSGVALIRKCLFSNGNTGVSVSGAYGKQNIAILDCRFFNIILPDTTWGSGVPVSIGNVANALVENCSFVSNGIPWSYSIPSGTLHGKGRMISIGSAACDVIGCEFRANRMTASKGSGSACIYIYQTPARRLRVERCLFAGNELVGRSTSDGQWGAAADSDIDSGMIYMFPWDSSYTLDILNCTFAYNTIDNGAAAMLSVVTGIARIRNSIFFGNISSSDNHTGSDIVLQTTRDDWTATADIAHSLFAEDSDKFFYAGRCGSFTIDRTSMVFGDPLFVTPQSTVTNLIRSTNAGSATTSATRWRSNFAYTADSQPTVAAFDLHLRSAAGTLHNDGTWHKYSEVSPAIDKGDPDADFSAEPTPNGGRINIGYYGGTASASKTLEAFPGVQDGTIGITFPGGVSQPQLDFTVVDTEGGSFSGAMTVYVGTADGWTVTNEYATVPSGTRYQFLVPDCYPAGATLKVQVVIVAGGKTVTVNAEKTVTGEPSVYYGKGGGSTVFHVRPGATGRGDGSDWFHAFAGDIHDAVSYIGKQELTGVAEVWCAMQTNTLTETKSGLNPAQDLTIRGGFEGLETDASDRTGWRTVCVADGLRTPMAAANATAALTLERFAFTDGAGRGFEKSGKGDLTLANCRFYENVKSGSVDGRGVKATGTAGTTQLTITNCVFDGNSNTDLGTTADVSSGAGGALYVENFARVTIDDSLFITNGLVWNVSHPKSGNAGLSGCAIFAKNAPLTVRGTAFRGNRGGTSKNSGEAGVVALNAGTAGSAFTNCLFAANCESWHQNNGPGPYGGALKINTGDTNTFVTVDNCTFFANLSDGTAVAAGVNVVSGAVRIENSLFNGNMLGNQKSGEYAADMVVAANAVAEVDYTLFAAADSVRAKVDGLLTLGSNVIYGDAKLVTGTNELSGITQQTDSCTVFKPAVRAAALAWDAHPRSPAGTCLNGGTWTNYTNDVSVAVDGGDPNASYALEPAPNGSRLNLGCYGNTAEASKTKEAYPEVQGGNIDVTFPNGITQPKIDFTVIEAGGGTFSAVVTVYVSTGSVESVAKVLGDVAPGAISVTPPVCYLPDDQLTVRVVVTVGGKTAEATKTVTVTGQVSPHYGKGGQGVFHVRPGATGSGDGSDWFNAWDGTVQEAVLRSSQTVTEFWIAAKTNLVDRSYSALTRSTDLVIRGGFSGTECAASERAAGACTVMDGANTYTALYLDAMPSVTLDALSFERGKQHGLYKGNVTGGSDTRHDVTLINCRFVRNGLATDGGVNGRGAFLKGNYYDSPKARLSTLTMTNCFFADNYNRDAYENSTVNSGTGGAYIWNWQKVVMDGCVFTNNCNRFDYKITTSGCDDVRGAACYARNAPVTARNCRFCFNHGGTGGDNFGGIVALYGSSGGSAFTNCLFMGNVEQWHGSHLNGWNSGALKVETGDTANPVEVVNCTVFANLSDGGSCSAGVNVRSGAVKIRNSILFANTVGYRRAADAGDDLIVQTNAVADVAYTLFTATDSMSARLGGTINLGAGILYGDAGLISDYATVTNAIVDVQGSQGMTTWFAPDRRGDILGLNAHLRGAGGYRDEKTSLRVAGTRGRKSRCLDAADPAASFANEPTADPFWHGRRANLGCYGNTPWATLTPKPGTAFSVR